MYLFIFAWYFKSYCIVYYINRYRRYLRGAGKPPGSRHDSPDELKRGSFHLLPNYGTILPSTRATFCLCQAQNDASGENLRAVYHRHSEYVFRLQMRGFAREKPYSRFYPSPFTFSPETPINTGVVRGEGLAPPFTTLHPPFTLSRSPAIIEDRSWS